MAASGAWGPSALRPSLWSAASGRSDRPAYIGPVGRPLVALGLAELIRFGLEHRVQGLLDTRADDLVDMALQLALVNLDRYPFLVDGLAPEFQQSVGHPPSRAGRALFTRLGYA